MYLVEELVHIYIHHRERQNGQSAQLVRNLSVRRSRAGSADTNGEKSVTNSIANLTDPPTMKMSKVTNATYSDSFLYLKKQILIY